MHLQIVILSLVRNSGGSDDSEKGLNKLSNAIGFLKVSSVQRLP